MKPENYIAANKAGWEEAAPLHRSQNHAGLLEAFRQPGYSWLGPVETEVLEKIGIEGLEVAQLCCNNGREILSVKNLGAGRCAGFDQAEGFIGQARELAEAGGIDCAFHCCDVHRIPPAHDGSFDLVFITIGVLSWMPDLTAFMAVPARLLRPGGRLFIYEQHPILGMLEPGKAGDPVLWNYSYFKSDPWIETEGLDYYGGRSYRSKPLYSFQYKMSDVLMACARNGLDRLEQFEERPEHISNTFWNLERQGPALPMSYTLVVRKPAETG